LIEFSGGDKLFAEWVIGDWLMVIGKMGNGKVQAIYFPAFLRAPASPRSKIVEKKFLPG
jgi:hypothetical protein